MPSVNYISKHSFAIPSYYGNLNLATRGGARLGHARKPLSPHRIRSVRLPGLHPASHRRPSVHVAAAANHEGLPRVPVRFVLPRHIDFGKTHRIVGDLPELGSWDCARGNEMTWSDGDKWHAEINVPAGTTFEFKIVEMTEGGNAVWEPNHNHAIAVPDSGATSVTVTIQWGSEVDLAMTPSTAGAAASSAPSFSSQSTIQGLDATARASAEIAAEAAIAEAASRGTSSSSSRGVLSVDSPVASFEERLPTTQWSGRETVFMRSNEHSSDRAGIWNTSGLEGAALKLVAGDRDAPSWLNKLELAKRTLVDDAPMCRPDHEALAHTFVYLSWVATGALPCVDAGGHRRPNHHADLSKVTFRTLEWVVAERAGGSDALLARRLQTRLPSFAAEFTQSTPLTRIRDIAHRNDIPQALKSEIKHTIQNKLHRNAGPEDLVATETMLAKVTANPGEYPEAFVSEMRTFYLELCEFFNAGGLSDVLTSITPTMDDSSSRVIDRFVACKRALDNAGASADDNTLMDALHGTASVRALLASGLSSGLRNDAPDRALAMRQRWRLAEIRTEDYAFMLLSRFINALEERGGSAALAAGNDGTWGLPLGALVIALRHVGLCGFQPAECMAIERELATWQRLGNFSNREEALRLRATLQRAQRLTEGYCQMLLDSLSAPAATLGAALGIDDERQTVFAESEIRANVVFQLSKLALILRRATTMVAQTTPWDVIMSGTSTGVLIEAAALEPGCLDAGNGQDAIIVVEAATGDEEVSALGSNLKGVVLRHHLPHLSHLGVRTRQEKVCFVTCDDEEEVERTIRGLMGKRVVMTSEVDNVAFELAGEQKESHKSVTEGNKNGTSNGNGNGSAASTGPAIPSSGSEGWQNVKKVDKVVFVPLEAATTETCGAKAAACGELLALANECAAAVQTSGRGDGSPLFEAARGVCLPFGCLEAALKSDGKVAEFSSILARAHTAASNGASAAELDAFAAEINDIIESVRIPQSILMLLGGAFDPGSTVIVRSSANVEDLAGMSGAGLYESIPNIDPKDPTALQSAITGVWASLHTRRALLARAAAGVDSSAADMAVMVQQQLAPELSFVLHTAHPLTRDNAALVAEIAPGMGETLASGTRGSAWRLEVERETGVVKTLAFANFSQALMPVKSFTSASSLSSASLSSSQGSSGEDQEVVETATATAVGAAPTPTGLSLATAAALSAANAATSGAVSSRVVDYSQQELSWSDDVRGALGRRLAAVGRLLESEFEGPQDVEGCVVEGRLYIVQTRPQP